MHSQSMFQVTWLFLTNQSALIQHSLVSYAMLKLYDIGSWVKKSSSQRKDNQHQQRERETKKNKERVRERERERLKKERQTNKKRTKEREREGQRRKSSVTFKNWNLDSRHNRKVAYRRYRKQAKQANNSLTLLRWKCTTDDGKNKKKCPGKTEQKLYLRGSHFWPKSICLAGCKEHGIDSKIASRAVMDGHKAFISLARIGGDAGSDPVCLGSRLVFPLLLI